MKNTLHKKKPYYLQLSGLNPQSNCSLLCVWHFWSLGQSPFLPWLGLQRVLSGIGSEYAWISFLHTLKLTKLNFERYMVPTWRKSYYLFFSFLQLSAAPHTCLHTPPISPNPRVQILHIEFFLSKLKVELFFWYLPFIGQFNRRKLIHDTILANDHVIYLFVTTIVIVITRSGGVKIKRICLNQSQS